MEVTRQEGLAAVHPRRSTVGVALALRRPRGGGNTLRQTASLDGSFDSQPGHGADAAKSESRAAGNSTAESGIAIDEGGAPKPKFTKPGA